METRRGRGFLAVEILHKKIVKNAQTSLVKSVPFWEGWGVLRGNGGYPPPPLPLKALTGAGFTKCVRKILSRKELKVKILITKDLSGHSRPLADRSRLDHDPLSCLWMARADVTMRRVDSGLLGSRSEKYIN